MATELIPIHTSDRGTFKSCRRRWNWSSPARGNLRAKTSSVGISFPLVFGSVIHKALEEKYNPTLSRDPVEVFLTEWRLAELDVQEKNSAFFEAYEEEFVSHREMGISMMEYYKIYSDKHDNFRVVHTEYDFTVPLFDNVVYKGRMDAIVQDLETGRYGIIDHKTTSRFDEEYYLKLDMDEQCTSYLWAANKDTSVLDGVQVEFIVYNTLRKTCIRPPTVLKSGLLSINRASESCTYDMFMTTIKERGLQEWLDTDEKAQGYVEYLKDVGDEQFVARKTVKRNANELINAGERIMQEAREMLDPNLALYPNPTGSFYCLRCPFRAPCIAMNEGSNYQFMIDENYELNMKAGKYTVT